MKRAVKFALFIFLLIIPQKTYAEEVKVGVTFSQVQCEYLDLNWRKIYKKTMALDLDVIRLGAYWSRIEKSRDKFDFSELDWQIQQAKENNIPVLLTVGMKAPRWPEYFIPAWLMKDLSFRFGSAVSDRKIIKERSLLFIRRVVERYKKEAIIVAWQVENEPLNRAGPKDWRIRNDFLQEEIDLVEKLDTRSRPIVINAMTYLNRILRFFNRLIYTKNPVYQIIDIADIPAFNIYSTIGHKLIGQKICFLTVPQKRLKYLKRFVDYAKAQDKTVWVTELQAEPWEPGELVHIRKEAAITCRAEDFPVSFGELEYLGVDTVFFWGVEYWFYRMQYYKDKSWLDAFEQIP
ncbi:MAG: beta-galactosidase [Candidatus Omnitrophica bacterium]|nr:beta-galactosidase [Candidatus Omnitrophota bacterium]